MPSFNPSAPIQRLKKPGINTSFCRSLLGFKEDLKELNWLEETFFVFDIMDQPMYQGCALPKAFMRVREHEKAGNIVTDQITVPIRLSAKASFNGNDTSSLRGRNVYIISPREHIEDVRALVLAEAEKGLFRTGGRTFFQQALSGIQPYNDLQGWFGLEGSYFFFINKDMFERTARNLSFDMNASLNNGTEFQYSL